MYSNLKVIGEVVFESNLMISSNLIIGETIDVEGDGVFSGGVNIEKNLYIASNISVGEDIYIESDVSVGRELYVFEDIECGGSFRVESNVYAKGEINVSGVISVGSNVSIVGDALMGGSVSVGSDVTCENLNVVGGVVNMSNVEVRIIDGLMNVDGSMNVTKGIMIDGVPLELGDNGGGNIIIPDGMYVEHGYSAVVKGNNDGEHEVVFARIHPRGGIFGEFERIFGLMGGSFEETEFLSGPYIFSSNHDWVENEWKWKLLVLSGSNIIYPDGSGNIDMTTNTSKIGSGSSTRDVTVNFIDDSGISIENNIYVVPDEDDNELTFFELDDLQVYNPYSAMKHNQFAKKAEIDFEFVHRDSEKRERIVPNYVYMPDSRMHVYGTKEYTIVYMGYYDLSIYNSELHTHNGWYLPSDADLRRTKIINVVGIGSDNIDDASGSLGFPFISFKRWCNSAKPSFKDCVYKGNMLGWGESEPKKDYIFRTLSDLNFGLGLERNNWILELYKRTYFFVKYGASQYVDNVYFDNNKLEKAISENLRIKKEGLRYIVTFLASSIEV